jgi:hypothetical protein
VRREESGERSQERGVRRGAGEEERRRRGEEETEDV